MCVLCQSDVCLFQVWPDADVSVTSMPTEASTPGDPVTAADGADGVDALITSYVWSAGTVTFGFTSGPSDYAGSTTALGEEDEFLAFGAAGENMIRAAAASVDAAVALALVETSPDTAATADIRIGGSFAPPTAWAYLPGPGTGGDIWVGVDMPYNALFAAETESAHVGSYEYYVAIHEIGHALGLKHPHQALAGNSAVMATDLDALEYTVMSYNSFAGGLPGSLTNQVGHFPQSLMMLDLAALHDLYGADYTTLSGDTVYTLTPTTGTMIVDGVAQDATMRNVVFRTLWDGGGTDLIDLSAYATDLTVDLRPGAGIDLDTGGVAQKARLGTLDGSAVYAGNNVYMSLLADGDTASLIEDAKGGSGDDVLIGNAADNRLSGGAGDDDVWAGAGNDTLTGGQGSDSFVLDLRDGGAGHHVIADLAFDGAELIRMMTALPGTFTVNALEGGRTAEYLGIADLVAGIAAGDLDVTGTGDHGVTLALAGLTGPVIELGGITEAALGVDPLSEPADPDPPVDPVTDSTDSDPLATALAAGALFVEGTDGGEVLRARGAPTVVAGYGGNDKLWGGAADDVLAGGAGSDRFMFDLRNGDAGHDVIADLAFDGAERISILTSVPGTFDDGAMPGNVLHVGGDGASADVDSFADIAEALASGALSVMGEGAWGVMLQIAGHDGSVLELAGIAEADLLV